ncbi:MAG: restriction endonuclease subunit S [Dolichospermum sp. DET73]|nr:restriction endonuclease subunit S [Dolichospermum sp. DET73]
MKLSSSLYDKYKVSDNEWYEYIPSEWHEKRVKDIFNLITDLAPNNNDFELLSLYTSIGVKPRKEMEQRGNKSVTTDGYWIVKKGDIIVNKLLAWMGAIGLSEYDGVTSPAYDILRKSNNEVDERFYTYLFRIEKSQAIFKKYSRGIMDVRLRLYFDKFGAITVPFPPPSEQKKIANYLDTKTTQIDKKIDLLTQKAKLYSNLKQSLINETVTRGLDKTVPMKDSGIEWIDKIPEHWGIKHLKDLAEIKGGKDSKVVEVETGGYPVYGSGGVFGRASQYLQNKPSVLLGRKGTIDKPLFVTEAFWSVDTMFYTNIKNNVYPKFFYYQCLTIQFGLYQYGSAVPSMAQNVLRQILFATPPLPEQKEIADYLDTKTTQIDKIIATINTQIEKLKELHKTLINDVVTGKIKVVQL